MNVLVIGLMIIALVVSNTVRGYGMQMLFQFRPPDSCMLKSVQSDTLTLVNPDSVSVDTCGSNGHWDYLRCYSQRGVQIQIESINGEYPFINLLKQGDSVDIGFLKVEYLELTSRLLTLRNQLNAFVFCRSMIQTDEEHLKNCIVELRFIRDVNVQSVIDSIKTVKGITIVKKTTIPYYDMSSIVLDDSCPISVGRKALALLLHDEWDIERLRNKYERCQYYLYDIAGSELYRNSSSDCYDALNDIEKILFNCKTPLLLFIY